MACRCKYLNLHSNRRLNTQLLTFNGLFLKWKPLFFFCNVISTFNSTNICRFHWTISYCSHIQLKASIQNSSSILECCLVSNEKKIVQFLVMEYDTLLMTKKKSEYKMRRWLLTIYAFEYHEDIKNRAPKAFEHQEYSNRWGIMHKKYSIVCETNNCWSDALKAMPSLWDDYQFETFVWTLSEEH